MRMAGRTIDIKRTKERPACTPYTSKIIKAGALLVDTKTLLSHWDVGVSVQENLHRLRRENVFGKPSRSRVENVLAIFRQRYLTETPVTKALVVLVQHRSNLIAKQVEEHRLVAWYDPEKAYAAAVKVATTSSAVEGCVSVARHWRLRRDVRESYVR